MRMDGLSGGDPAPFSEVMLEAPDEEGVCGETRNRPCGLPLGGFFCVKKPALLLPRHHAANCCLPPRLCLVDSLTLSLPTRSLPFLKGGLGPRSLLRSIRSHSNVEDAGFMSFSIYLAVGASRRVRKIKKALHFKIRVGSSGKKISKLLAM